MPLTPEDAASVEPLLVTFDGMSHELTVFMEAVVATIARHPRLLRVVHSHKSRLKSRDHLAEKILRKRAHGREISADNLFVQFTDLAGVRFLHIFQEQAREIDAVIRAKVASGDWVFSERPKAFTWDPESEGFFRDLGLDVESRETFYTSVHYLVRPRVDSPLCCEIQVRTLFEEIWGEVDHEINYPAPTANVASREQLLVLSKLVGAGSRLLDSIRRTQDVEADAPPAREETVAR